MSVQEKIRLKRAQIKYIRRYNRRQKALKVILCVLLIAFAIDAITAVLNSKRVISISANPAMARSTSEDAVAEVSTLSGDTAHEASEPMAQSPDDIESKIKAAFPEDSETMLAIAKAESRLKTDAKNWNCYYNGKSTSCKPEDREKAWSVDCGVFQINTIAKTCPAELFDVDHNIKVAKKIKKSQGYNAWYTYRHAIANNLPI